MVTALAVLLTGPSPAPSTVRRPWSEVQLAVLLATALCCWPNHTTARLAALFPRPAERHGALVGPGRFVNHVLRGPRRGVALVVFAALVGALVAGIGGAVAFALAAGLGVGRWQGAALGRQHGAQRTALLEAVAMMAAELRAGAHPATAAATAAEAIETAGGGGSSGALGLLRSDSAQTAGDAAHRVLVSVAAGARLGAEVPVLFERHAQAEPAIADELRRVAGAWTLAERHGVALAELMDAVRSDLDACARLSGQIRAQLAGPRSTAGVLAGLPLVGVLLGQGMGANPWGVLTGTPVGQVLLVVGTGLGCAGVAWSGRITARAVPR